MVRNDTRRAARRNCVGVEVRSRMWAGMVPPEICVMTRYLGDWISTGNWQKGNAGPAEGQLQWELALRDSNEIRAAASSSKLGITLSRRSISRTIFTLPRALRSLRLAPRFRRETKARTMVLMLELSI